MGNTAVLKMFDDSLAALPENLRKEKRAEFEQEYLNLLLSMIPATHTPPEQIATNIKAMYDSVLTTSQLIGNRKLQGTFSNLAMSAVEQAIQAAQDMGVDLRGIGVNPPGMAAPGTEAPATAAPGAATPGTAAAPGTATPGTAAPGTATPGMAAPGTAAAPAMTGADLREKMTDVARKAVTQSIGRLTAEMGNIPADEANFIFQQSKLDAAKYGELLSVFINRFFSDLGDGFSDYYQRYGTGTEAENTVATSVFKDFDDIGQAFLYQMLEYAALFSSDREEDEAKRAELKKYASVFDNKGRNIWKNVRKGEAGMIAEKAKSIAESIGKSAFDSEAVRRSGSKSEAAINENLFNAAGYDDLYQRFIGAMKELSPYSEWQKMLNQNSTPGQIESGALDKMQEVWMSARQAASTDKSAKDFLKKFGRTVNFFAVNNIAKSKINSEKTFKEDKNSDRFVDYLMSQINSAAGIPVSNEADTNPDQKYSPDKFKPPTSDLPVPSSSGGTGTSSYALGVMILSIYRNKFNFRKPQGGEKLKLNQPGEKVQLNRPEAPQPNQPDSATSQNLPKSPAVAPPSAKAPAVPGG